MFQVSSDWPSAPDWFDPIRDPGRSVASLQIAPTSTLRMSSGRLKFIITVSSLHPRMACHKVTLSADGMEWILPGRLPCLR